MPPRTSSAIVLLSVIACNPKDQSGGTSASEADSASGPMTDDDATAVTSELSSSSSDTASTTSASTTSASTGVIETCPWYQPEFQGLHFCPPPLEMGTEISGTSQFGPASFKFARFGLMTCALCPHARQPSLVLYNEPWTADSEDPPGDYLRLLPYTEGRIGFHFMNLNGAEITLEITDIPDVEATSPPLDESAPPLLSGTLALKSDGWDLAGAFVATLCTDLDWTPPCE